MRLTVAMKVIKESYLIVNRLNAEPFKIALTQRVLKIGRDISWSDVLIDWPEVALRQAFLIREGNHYRIYGGDGGNAKQFGLFQNGDPVHKEYGSLLDYGTTLYIGNPAVVTLRYCTHQSENIKRKVIVGNEVLPKSSNRPFSNTAESRFSTPLTFSLSKRPTVIIGSDHTANWQLKAPTIASHHSQLKRYRNHYWLENLDRHNHTFVNEQAIRRKTRLKRGDVFQIGPFSILFSSSCLYILARGNGVNIQTQAISVDYGNLLKSKNVLNDVSLSCQTGQIVALVGGSGAGKSTLMKALLGVTKVGRGQVRINGYDLQQKFNLYRTQIGYVPQDDIIHAQLTVNAVLRYACQLRLPPKSPVREIVTRVLQQVDMLPVRNLPVRKLSGGQRKRVSIAVELLSDPKILFLDEPTSGLDPGLDRQLMRLLQNIAKDGRLVVLVTHATENIGVCDRIAFLGPGGWLCYFGSPNKAVSFFRNLKLAVNSFTDIYTQLNKGDKFKQSETIAKYWKTKYLPSITAAISQKDANSQSSVRPRRPRALPIRQFFILSRRYLTLVLQDYRSVALSLLTAPIAIALITLAMPDEQPFVDMGGDSFTQAPLALRTLFIFTCAALWVGLSSAIQEIVKEASIYRRERLINLSIYPYVTSKLFVRALLALGQTALISLTILYVFESPSPEAISWPLGLGITTLLTLIAASSLGLLISALVTSAASGNNMLPLVLLPQIIFSGVLFELQGIASKVSWLTIGRWSMGAYGTLVDVNAMVPTTKEIRGVTLPPLAFEPSSTYEPTVKNLWLNWSILLFQIVLYMTLAGYFQKRKDDI